MKLQKTPYAYMNGAIIPWDEAKIHVGSEGLIRGISVFEGIKGYWQSDSTTFSLLALREHYDRLRRSASLMHLPFDMGFDAFEAACLALVRRLVVPGKDLWLRPTIFAVEGNWGLDTRTDLVITAYTQEMKRPEPIDVGISAWQRPGDAAQPSRIKSAANYQVSRMARIEGRGRGFADMILTNQWGRIAEATGSCVLMVRDGVVATPPCTEGCLESITVNVVERICSQVGVPFTRRPVDRSELFVADELCLVGTLAELALIRKLDYMEMTEQGDVLKGIADVFWEVVRGTREVPRVFLTPI